MSFFHMHVPVFCCTRLVAEQESLKAAIAAAEGDPKLQRRIRTENAVKYYVSTIVVCTPLP